MSEYNILVVEDDLELREALCDTLELSGYGHLQADTAEEALKRLNDERVDMVVSDVNMSGMDGHQLLDRIHRSRPYLPVLLITAYARIDRAVDAIRNGAVDYLVKPFEPNALVETVERCLNPFSGQAGDHVIAEDAATVQLFGLAQKVADTDSTVLLTGESGVGKEVVARYIHAQSRRAQQPFVAINCAAIPDTMLEATLFGHEKGAFTGAHQSHPGKFEQANGGTLLLDEISEMPLQLQAKLLRVLQENEVERIGGKKSIPLELRILATTNRCLEEEVGENRFREDLYYRLNVFPLRCPALRERPADIAPLAKRLAQSYALQQNKPGVELEPAAEAKLKQHSWPGNVRELDNVIQRALILQVGDTITEGDLYITQVPGQTAAVTAQEGALASADEISRLDNDLKQRESEMIIETLRTEGGNRKRTADKLGISPRTLRYKLARMRESGIDLDEVS